MERIAEQEAAITGIPARAGRDAYRRAAEAKRSGGSCGKCGRAVHPDEPLYATRLHVGYRQRLHTVVCEDCAPEYAREPQEFYHYGRRLTLYEKDPCEWCGQPVVWVERSDQRRHWLCSEACTYRYYNRRRYERALAAREGRVCEQCGSEFDAARSDQRYCSGACRQRAYRLRAGRG